MMSCSDYVNQKVCLKDMFLIELIVEEEPTLDFHSTIPWTEYIDFPRGEDAT